MSKLEEKMEELETSALELDKLIQVYPSDGLEARRRCSDLEAAHAALIQSVRQVKMAGQALLWVRSKQ